MKQWWGGEVFVENLCVVLCVIPKKKKLKKLGDFERGGDGGGGGGLECFYCFIYTQV